jgi:hypothetical protein
MIQVQKSCSRNVVIPLIRLSSLPTHRAFRSNQLFDNHIGGVPLFVVAVEIRRCATTWHGTTLVGCCSVDSVSEVQLDVGGVAWCTAARSSSALRLTDLFQRLVEIV